jgi:hypothetical protein
MNETSSFLNWEEFKVTKVFSSASLKRARKSVGDRSIIGTGATYIYHYQGMALCSGLSFFALS